MTRRHPHTWRVDFATRTLTWYAAPSRLYRIQTADDGSERCSLAHIEITSAGFRLLGLGVHASLYEAMQRALSDEGLIIEARVEVSA